MAHFFDLAAGTVCIDLDLTLDTQSIAALANEIAAMNTNVGNMVIDLASVTYLDGAGIGAVAHLYGRADALGTRAVLLPRLAGFERAQAAQFALDRDAPAAAGCKSPALMVSRSPTCTTLFSPARSAYRPRHAPRQRHLVRHFPASPARHDPLRGLLARRYRSGSRRRLRDGEPGRLDAANRTQEVREMLTGAGANPIGTLVIDCNSSSLKAEFDREKYRFARLLPKTITNYLRAQTALVVAA